MMIDWPKVLELREEVGHEDFDEVVELFLEEVDDTIQNLGDPGRSLEHDLHFLKGSALNLGFSSFSDLCKQGEYACAGGTSDTVNTTKILECYATSKTQFLSLLPKQLGA